jgi:hypothetical protein
MFYKAEYKDERDGKDYKRWDLGIHKDKAAALAELNRRPDVPGTFSFDEPPDNPVTQGYYLSEWEEKVEVDAPTSLHQLYLRK